jgi:hypothetical protein
VIKEMQTKTTFRFHFSPVRAAIIGATATTNASKDAVIHEPLYTAGGNVN